MSSQLHSIEPGPLTMTELKVLLATLPAERRSAIAWSIPAIEEALDCLIVAPLDDQLVDECALRVIRAFSSLGNVVGPAASTGTMIHAAVELLDKHRSLLRTSLSPAAAQTAEWLLRLITSVLSAVSKRMPANDGPMPATGDDDLVHAFQQPGGGSFLRVQALLFAVLHAIEPDRVDDITRARAEALVELAGKHAATFMNYASASGFELDVFNEEPAHHRVRRLKAQASRVRAALSEEDRQILRDAWLRER